MIPILLLFGLPFAAIILLIAYFGVELEKQEKTTEKTRQMLED